ncbi:MAG TPA: globin domain-containing protein [Ignavibacteria bacterium]
MDYKNLTKEEIKLIQDSFAQVCDNSNITAKLLYDKLFESHPEISKIFKGDMHEQEAKLMQMMKTVVSGLNNPHIIVSAIQELGKKHFEIGVIPAHYEKFRQALFYSFEMQLAGDFTPEIRAAWQKLYDILAEAMQGLQYK